MYEKRLLKQAFYKLNIKMGVNQINTSAEHLAV